MDESKRQFISTKILPTSKGKKESNRLDNFIRKLYLHRFSKYSLTNKIRRIWRITLPNTKENRHTNKVTKK